MALFPRLKHATLALHKLFTGSQLLLPLAILLILQPLNLILLRGRGRARAGYLADRTATDHRRARLIPSVCALRSV